MRALTACSVAAVLVLAACGGDDSSNATLPDVSMPVETTPLPTEAPTTTSPTTTSSEVAVTESTPPATEPPATEPVTTDSVVVPVESNPDTGTFEITADIAGGQPVGGVRSYIVDVGTTVQITITSDVAEEAHLHGYDIEQELEPGVPYVMTFTADQTGSFELELHGSEALILYLDVS